MRSTVLEKHQARPALEIRLIFPWEQTGWYREARTDAGLPRARRPRCKLPGAEATVSLGPLGNEARKGTLARAGFVGDTRDVPVSKPGRDPQRDVKAFSSAASARTPGKTATERLPTVRGVPRRDTWGSSAPAQDPPWVFPGLCQVSCPSSCVGTMWTKGRTNAHCLQEPTKPHLPPSSGNRWKATVPTPYSSAEWMNLQTGEQERGASTLTTRPYSPLAACLLSVPSLTGGMPLPRISCSSDP